MIIPRRKPYFHPKTLQKILKGADKSESAKLESDLKRILGTPNPVVVESGRIALRLILEAADIPKGSEIIMPAYTFGLLTKSIASSGFVPKPVDIDPETFQMDVNQVKKAINKETGAILATHLFGNPCNIAEISKLAKNKKVLLIEDCAESIGAKSRGKLTGTFGDVAFSSFNIAKPLQGINGGVIYGRNVRLINKIKKSVALSGDRYETPWGEIIRGMAGFLATQTIFWFPLMYLVSLKKVQEIFVKSYRSGESKTKSRAFVPQMQHTGLAPMLAAIVRLNLNSFKKRLEKRRKILDLYGKYLPKQFRLAKISKYDETSAYMIVGLIDKDPFLLRRYLALRGIDVAIREEVADNLLAKPQSQAKIISKKAVALPVYESLNENEIKRVALNLTKFLNRN